MKIRSSRYKRRTVIATSDPEEIAFEKRMAEHRANIERLEAHKAELDCRVTELTQKIMGKDWLMYLPRAAGSADLIQRACTYLEAMRTRLKEEDGTLLWLCADHDCSTRIFEITEFRAFAGSVFCSGEWTALGRAYRHAFKGVSHDNITYAGDIGLLTEMTPPAVPCMNLADMPAHVRAANQLDSVRGLVGAACLSFPPAYGKTGIYRLTHDKKRIIDANHH